MISAETYNSDYEKAVKFGYNKGIDEFAERISTFGTYDYHGNKIDVLEIAEQLKEE